MSNKQRSNDRTALTKVARETRSPRAAPPVKPVVAKVVEMVNPVRVFPANPLKVVTGRGGRRHRRRRGFSLVELMLAVVVLGAVGLGVMFLIQRFVATGGGDTNEKFALQQAKAWTARHVLKEDSSVSAKDVSYECMRAARNSLVRCSVSVPLPRALPRIYTLECASASNLVGDEGCWATGFPQ